MRRPWAVTALLTLTATLAAAGPASKHEPACRCLPADDCWPSSSSWDSLNKTINGRLIATVPVGAPCHDPDYDEEACAAVRESWMDPRLHLPSSSSVMAPFFANQSCDPFTPREQPCLLGNYVSYSANASTPEDVSASLKFAKKNNIRVVVRNTGHDMHGRSTGAGALSIWTHHLRSTEVIAQYKSAGYTGPALRVGAGVIGAEAAQAADRHGLTVVTGECPSVGVAGGFTQGGGHSLLSTSYGLAADQVLEYEVVTADGEIRTASPEEHSDLYWALSGGGPGNFAVVTSMTVRAHLAGTVGGGLIRIQINDLPSPEVFGEVIRRFHALAPAIIDHGASVVYTISAGVFKVGPFTLVNSTGEYIRDTVAAPFLAALEELEVTAETSFSTLSSLEHYDHYLGPLPWGTLATIGLQFGGRVVPRSALEGNNNNTAVADIITDLVSQGTIAVGTVASYTPPDGVSNAVNPGWRTGIMQLTLATQWSSEPEDWDANLAMQEMMTDEIMPRVKEATPGGTTYMNEADFREPNWKEEFYGDHYGRLLKVKKEWDPEGLLYVYKGVGSDAWDVGGDGRMCRRGKR